MAKKVEEVIVIDPVPARDALKVKQETAAGADKMSKLKTEYDEKVRKLQASLITNKAELSTANAKLSAKSKAVDEMKKQLDQKTDQLKQLRANVCKLLQVLVPEIDVDCEEGQGDVDEC